MYTSAECSCLTPLARLVWPSRVPSIEGTESGGRQAAAASIGSGPSSGQLIGQSQEIHKRRAAATSASAAAGVRERDRHRMKSQFVAKLVRTGEIGKEGGRERN